MISNLSTVYNKKLKEALLLVFYDARRNIDDEPTKILFTKYLIELKKYDAEKILARLDWYVSISTERFLPKIGEIIAPFIQNEKDELELKWTEFRTNMNNDLDYRSIPDWIYTLKKRIGSDRCGDITTENLVWLKKEFIDIYPSFKKGLIEIQSDPKKYIEEGATVLIENKKTYDSTKINDCFGQMKGLLKGV